MPGDNWLWWAIPVGTILGIVIIVGAIAIAAWVAS